jgi:hypothetical protein
VLHQINKNTINQPINLFKPKDSYRTQGSSDKKSSLTQGSNLPNGVIVHFNLKDFDDKKDTLALYFKEQNGTLIKKYSSIDKEDKLEIKVGGNTFVWDTRYKGAEILDGMIFWSASFSGPKAVPGNYEVILEKNGISQKQSFEILPDPRTEVTLLDMKEQFDFVNLVNTSVDKAHKAIKNIRTIRKKLEDFEVLHKENIKLNSTS